MIASRYVTLVSLGSRRPLPRLAEEFGLTREQARDRIHRARELGHLMPTKPGRVNAEPGPKLLRPLPPDPCSSIFVVGEEKLTCTLERGHPGHHIAHGLRFQPDTVDPNPPKSKRRKGGKNDAR